MNSITGRVLNAIRPVLRYTCELPEGIATVCPSRLTLRLEIAVMRTEVYPGGLE